MPAAIPAAIGAVGAIGGAVISGNAAKKAGRAQQAAADRQLQMQWDMYQQQRQDQAPWRAVGGNALNELALRLGIGGFGGAIGGGGNNLAAQALSGGSLIELAADGTPIANPELYASNDAYRKAWDTLLQQHVDWAGQGYRFDSDASEIENALRANLAAQQRDFQNANPAEKNPLYGSLLKRFSEEDFRTDPGYEFRLGEGQKALESSAAARGGLLSGAAAKALTKFNQDFASNEYGNAYNRFTNDQTNQFNKLANLAGVGQLATNATQTAGQNFMTGAGNALQYGGTARASAYGDQGNALAAGLGGASSFLGSMFRGGGGGGGFGYSGPGSLFGGSVPTYSMGNSFGFGA